MHTFQFFILTLPSWPGSNNISSDKVPSELAYVPASDDFEMVNSDGSRTFNILWGLQLKPDQSRLRCLKLRLDPRQKLPAYVSSKDLDDQLIDCGKSAEEAIADYLSLIFAKAKEELVRRFGTQMVSSTPLEINLTVPAIWSDAAKDATLRAAGKAGMGSDLHMISEPEAAAIYALTSMVQDSNMLQVGDNFIVCDAGGGEFYLCSLSRDMLTLFLHYRHCRSYLLRDPLPLTSEPRGVLSWHWRSLRRSLPQFAIPRACQITHGLCSLQAILCPQA